MGPSDQGFPLTSGGKTISTMVSGSVATMANCVATWLGLQIYRRGVVILCIRNTKSIN